MQFDWWMNSKWSKLIGWRACEVSGCWFRLTFATQCHFLPPCVAAATARQKRCYKNYKDSGGSSSTQIRLTPPMPRRKHLRKLKPGRISLGLSGFSKARFDSDTAEKKTSESQKSRRWRRQQHIESSVPAEKLLSLPKKISFFEQFLHPNKQWLDQLIVG